MAKPDREGIASGWAQRLLATGKVAGAAARLTAQRLIGAEADADGQLGEAIARELDQMKGVAMKVGQILSYFDGVLPEATHRALRRLQQGAQPLPFPAIEAQLEQAFGAPAADLFERLDPAPVAAASIGQVHRGRWAGREVAVKVQYPGVRQIMVSDVSRLRALSRLASVATEVDGPALVEELAERFRLECDYELEAAHQNAFRAAFAQESWAHIPLAFPERTRPSVLTTEWCEGRGFYELVEQGRPAEHDRLGLLLARFTLRCLFSAGMINADPHPGNYLFPSGDQVAFLDFGCVRRLEPDFLERQRHLTQVVVEDRRAAFRQALLDSGMVGQPRGFDFDLHWRTLRHELEPYRRPRFRFTPGYVRAGLALSKATNPNMRRLAIPPQWIWTQRLTWGLHAVLARLEAQGPFADEMRAALASRLRIG
jgi:predicted unusual protein kinase regulating ubiquinone biosynthesis (AarF/ABC1/UbiB family)